MRIDVSLQVNNNSYKETTAVQLASFIAEHNLPLTISPFLLELLKSRAPQNIEETKSLQEMRLGATKCTNIVRQGVGLFHAKELVEILRQKKFSIIPDETTDVSTAKQLAMCVMYVNDDLKPVNRFLDIVEATDTGAKGLYQSMKMSLEEKSIPLSNIIGYSSDTCNVMFGANLSVASCNSTEERYPTCCHHQMQLSYDTSLCISRVPKVVHNPGRFVQKHLRPL